MLLPKITCLFLWSQLATSGIIGPLSSPIIIGVDAAPASSSSSFIRGRSSATSTANDPNPAADLDTLTPDADPHRILQTVDCSSITRKRLCNNNNSCVWDKPSRTCGGAAPEPTNNPSTSPSSSPSKSPSVSPTLSPSRNPSKSPSSSPSTPVTSSPTSSPSMSPSVSPTSTPSKSPSSSPLASVTSSPSVSPTSTPSVSPSTSPSKSPSKSPSTSPTNQPTTAPSKSPSTSPSKTPSSSPSKSPSTNSPTNVPTTSPSKSPQVTSNLLTVVGDTSAPADSYEECQGDCANDNQCQGDLECFWRAGNLFPVPGCQGTGTAGRDYCAARPTENTIFLKGDNNNPASAFPLGLCEGDCDGNGDCENGRDSGPYFLTCQQRSGDGSVPGCVGTPATGEDYCRYPNAANIGNPPGRLLNPCEGDCDSDADCNTIDHPTLKCYQRAGSEAIPGCLGAGNAGTDYCANRPTENSLFLKGDENIPSSAFPLGLCEGDCDGDGDCEAGLICKQRGGLELVPGCEGAGVSGKDYCYDPNVPPTTSPTTKPSYAPNNVGATYAPGDLSEGTSCDDGKLTISNGMGCKLLTPGTGAKIPFADGTSSSQNMHSRADGAGIIPHPNDGGWYYVSNSEGTSGGVGTLRFDSTGDLIGYNRTLTTTSKNCGGGLTFWDTWVTCEENGSAGFCHEVDPHTSHTSKVKVVAQAGNYESFAYYRPDPEDNSTVRFFTTEDSSTGALVRYTPHPSAFTTGNKYDILTTDNGVHDYLVLNSDNTYYWSSTIGDGEASANTYFPNSEGIDCQSSEGILNFVSKVRKELFTLDLVAETWYKSSTVSGLFNLQPDQLGRIMGDNDVLYFCEDGGSNCDVHARDSTGQYYTIIRGDGYSTENTGLAFSPDNMFMYVAFQGNSNVYAFWREDGLAFNGLVAYTKYHASS